MSATYYGREQKPGGRCVTLKDEKVLSGEAQDVHLHCNLAIQAAFCILRTSIGSLLRKTCDTTKVRHMFTKRDLGTLPRTHPLSTSSSSAFRLQCTEFQRPHNVFRVGLNGYSGPRGSSLSEDYGYSPPAPSSSFQVSPRLRSRALLQSYSPP